MSNKSIFQGNRVSDDNTLALPNFNPRTNKYLDRVIPPKPKENIIADYNSIMNGYDNPEQTRPNHHHNNASIATKSQSNIQANHHSADQNLRNSINFFTKEAYRQDLDKQVKDNQTAKQAHETATKQQDLNLIQHYPFGQRTNPSSYLNHGHTVHNSYQMLKSPSGHPIDYRVNYLTVDKEPKNQSIQKIYPNNYALKPSSIHADQPSYDPIKYRNGNQYGYSYDPWGKPGGGAPMVDKDTGKLYTKISGQVWYDTIGISPDDRGKVYQNKTAPINEQRRLIEDSEKRRKMDEDFQKKPSQLDVSTWITNTGSDNMSRREGAHLGVTSVTREKIDSENVRRYGENTQHAKSYYQALSNQEEEKNRDKKLAKLKDDVAGMEHSKKWDQMWGRPGAGAPNGNERRRGIGTLESPRHHEVPREFAGKSLALSDSSQPGPRHVDNSLYGKTIRHSNHTNLYDNVPPDMQSMIR